MVVERLLEALTDHVGEITPLVDEILGYYMVVEPSVEELFPGSAAPRSDRLALAIAYTLADDGARVVQCGSSSSEQAVLCVEDADQAVRDQSDAFAMGHVIFCETVCEGDLLDHELVHVEQFEHYGDSFLLRYLAESAVNGTTCDNRYEIPAYEENWPCPHD